jgi:hypothetical protein
VRCALLSLLAIAGGCASTQARAPIELPSALRDAAAHPRFPPAAFLTAVGYGRDRQGSELDAKKRIAEALASTVQSECRLEQRAGPAGERDSAECSTRVAARFEQANLIDVDASLTQSAGEEWRAFAYLDRRKAEASLAQEQAAPLAQLLALWAKGADCAAERLLPEVRRGLLLRRSLVGGTADEARVAAEEQAAAARRAERGARAEVALLASGALGAQLARAVHERLGSLKVREGDGQCALGLRLALSAEESRRVVELGQLCELALTATATACGEAGPSFTLRSDPARFVTAADPDLACRRAAEKLPMPAFADEAARRVQRELGLSCEARCWLRPRCAPPRR